MTIINAVKKGKERKGKGLLYLIGIAVLISIVFIACNKKPTASNDFAEIDKDLPTSSSGSGNNTVTTTTISTANNIDSPVVVVSGNNLIIAYGEGNDINYRTSVDGGKSFSKAMRLIDSAQYPYIFFDGTTVSAIVTTYGGRIGELVPTLFEINGTFQSGGEAYLIKTSSSESMRGIVNDDDALAGGCSVLGADKYFGNGKTIRTAAGAGIGIGNSRQIPLSEVGGTTYLILEAKELTGGAQSGWGWDLKSGSKQTKGNEDVIKIAKDGSIFKTSDAAEKAGSYSIAANGTITGITGSPQVGNGTTEASIAEDGNGTIYTFTKEADGLVFRKFANTISGDIK